MIIDIKKVYENTIIKEQGENKEEQKEYICRIYKYLVTPKSFGVKENTYICYFEEIVNNPENNKNRNESGKEKTKNTIVGKIVEINKRTIKSIKDKLLRE
mgnify:CR=1 FL=1